MPSKIVTPISLTLYNKIVIEKKRLKDIENKKTRSRRRKITMITASASLARRL